MIRSRVRDRFGLLVVALAAIVLVPAYCSGVEKGGEEGNRVLATISPSGEIGVESGIEGKTRLGWKKRREYEYMGRGGIIIRFEGGDNEELYLLNCSEFEPVEIGLGERRIFEGCWGGKRYPSMYQDDDGDGRKDEEELDGRDNDGDGLVDEDFAAIGSKMTVSRAEHPESGLAIFQKSYRWDYSHVSDFLGFTTVLEYQDRVNGNGEIMDLEVALIGDFKIGAIGDEVRGIDDRYGWMMVECDEGSGKEKLMVGVVGERDGASGLVSLVVLGAIGPRGEKMEVRGNIVNESGGEVDSLWGKIRAEEEKEKDLTEYREGGVGDMEWLVGDLVIVNSLNRVGEFAPGDRVILEWGIVFGETMGVLKKNIKYLRTTYEGVTRRDGGRERWIVPARKAVLRELEVSPASFWTRGERKTAAAIDLGDELMDQEVEWLKVGEDITRTYKKIGSKVLIPIGEKIIEEKKPLEIRGQLGEGTIFTARITSKNLAEMESDKSVPPGELPPDYLQLYPNPFIKSLNISLTIGGELSQRGEGGVGLTDYGRSSVKIYNIKGHLVRGVMERDFLPPGEYMYGWEGVSDAGKKVAPGVYYCKLQIGDKSVTKRVILLR